MKKTLEIRLSQTCEAIDGRSKQRSGSVNQTQTTDKESSLPMAFPAESSTFFLILMLAKVEARATPVCTEIIIRATRTREVSGEKGRRIREATSVVQKGFGVPENSVEHFTERVDRCASGRLQVKQTSGWHRCSTGFLHRRPIQHGRWHEGLRGGDQWKNGPSPPSRQGTGVDRTAPSMADMNKLIKLKVPRKTLKAITLEKG